MKAQKKHPSNSAHTGRTQNARIIKADNDNDQSFQNNPTAKVLLADNDNLYPSREGSGVRNAEKQTSARQIESRDSREQIRKNIQRGNAVLAMAPSAVTSNISQLKTTRKTVRAAVSLPFIIGATFILYIWQFVFGLLMLAGFGMGMAYTGSLMVRVFTLWAGDGLGKGLLGAGITGVVVLYVLGLFVAGGILLSRRVNIIKGYSLAVAAWGLVCCFMPFANLIPWVWIWAIYVVKAQMSK